MPADLTRPLRRAVLRPHQTLEELARSEPPSAHCVGALAAGGLVSVGLIGPDGRPGEWRVRGMATAPDARGRGAGSLILAALLDHAAAAGATRVWCNARTPAITLYARAGFSVESGVFELPLIGPHVVMGRSIATTRSPRAPPG